MSDAGRMFSDGAAYERLMGRWSRRVGEPFIDWLGIPRDRAWVDVGCGNGAFTEVLIGRAAPVHVEGIDPSAGQIEFARNRAGAGRAVFQVGDAQALPYADASFDAAVMALVISFVPDPAGAVAEMVRVVRQGGTVATYMWDFSGGGMPLQPLYAAMGSMGLQPPMPAGFAVSRLGTLRSLWEGAGMEAVETRVIRIAVDYADFQDFWDSNVVPVGPQGMLISALSPSDKERLKSELRAHLPTGPDGRIAYEAFANAVKGRVTG